MAKMPVLKRIQREDFPEAPDWMDKLIYVLNTFMEGTYNAIDKQLTFGDNVQSAIKDIEVTTPATYGASVDGAVAARYTSNAGASYGTVAVVDFEDKDYDTHDAVTVGAAWKFTAPVSGYYTVSAAVGFVSAAYAINDAAYTILRKGGSGHKMLSFWRCQNALGYTNTVYLDGTGVVDLAAGEYCDVTVTNGRGSTATTTTLAYMNISIALWQPTIPAPTDFGSTVKFANPLKVKPQGIILLKASEKNKGDLPLYEAAGVSWRLNQKNEIEVSYIPGLAASTAYTVRLLVI